MQQDINKSADELTAQSFGNLPEWLTSKNGLIIILTIIVCMTVFVTHWPALSAQAISYDDNRYFVVNFLVRSPSLESAWRFLSEVFEPSTIGGYYQPLTMISLMLDYAIGGQTDSLVPFHRTSLILHAANTALIIVLLYQLFGSAWIAAAVGLLFGVHPLTVETIPWIGERKTLLAAFFVLWSLSFYIRFVRKGDRKAYLGCIAMYILALMSKPTSTPLPVMMLLMDFWPLRRLKWRSILEKLPLFVIGGISAVITYISQSRTASVIMPESYGPMRVPLVICHNIIFYLYKMVWPVNLSSHYAFPNPLGLSTPMVLAGVVGTFILIPILLVSLRWTRAALTGWLIFFIAVFPTMQMLQFSDVIASDKFVYLPSIGILMILAAFLSWIYGTDNAHLHTAKRTVVTIIILMLAGAESFATQQYLACWKDTASLFAHMTKVTPNAASPRGNWGVALAEEGDVNEAIMHFREILKDKPNNTDAHINLGKALADQGKYDEALAHYEKVLQLMPNDAAAYQHIAVVFANQGRVDEAIAMLRRGIEHRPQYESQLHIGLGTLFSQQGKIDEAIEEFLIAVKMAPDSATYNNLGAAWTIKGKIDEAMECYKKAIQLDPKNAEAYYNLGNVLLAMNELERAAGEYEKALGLNPNYTKAHLNLAVTLMQENRLDEAVKHLIWAAKIEPNNVNAHYNLAMVLGQQGKTGEAIDQFVLAAKIEPNSPDIHYGLAGALTEKGRLQEAADEYRQVLRLDPNDIDTRCILGDVLVKQGRFEEAAAEYNKVLKADPQNAKAQEGLKNISSKQQPAPATK